jgi:hypothetical protein
MENKIDIKKEWKVPSLEKLGVVKTLGGDLSNPEDSLSQPDGTNGGSGG